MANHNYPDTPEVNTYISDNPKGYHLNKEEIEMKAYKYDEMVRLGMTNDELKNSMENKHE